MKLSLWLALIFAGVGAVVSAGLVVRSVTKARAEAYGEFERLGSVTLEAVRSLVQAEAKQGRFLEMGRSFSDLVRQADIATILVRDRRGRRVVGRADDPGLLGREPIPNRPLTAIDDGVYDVEGPVELGNRGRGTVAVGFRTARLEARLRSIDAEGVGSGVMAFMALLMSAWLIGAMGGQRIARVVARLEVMADDPEKFRPLRPDASSGSELSRLIESFNRMGAGLKAERARRRELEAERSELSAMLVHDLKTPLTVIRSGIALLAEVSPRNAGVRDHQRTFDLLESSAKRLQRMVEDVLQLAKLDESSSLENIELIDIPGMAKSCAKDFELVTKDRKQNLELTLPDQHTPRVVGDPALLRRVLDNLVHNAVEHTPSGGRIKIGVAANDGRITVDVCDSGPGVPAEARAEIFRKFFQKDMKRHVGNVGLGLALCERVVLRHGGTIGVEDAVPKGARFFFILPGAPETTAA